MWRYFTAKNTYKYIDVLQDFIDAYNHSYHRSIGMKPVEVDYTNEDAVYTKLYGIPELKPKPVKFTYDVGDKVRISKQKAIFDKGYLPNWTEEIFTVCARYPRTPPVYKIKDYQDNVIEGTFYEAELQKVDPTSDIYIVERVVQREKRKGKDYVLVKWRGYPRSMNSWIPAGDLIVL